VCVCHFNRNSGGNPYYRHAVNQPFRSGRSRFFGYIEAQVLHAVIRHYKPARLIEIGGGVPSYCTSQAISMNRRDTGPNGHITCIEPDPVDGIAPTTVELGKEALPTLSR